MTINVNDLVQAIIVLSSAMTLWIKFDRRITALETKLEILWKDKLEE